MVIQFSMISLLAKERVSPLVYRHTYPRVTRPSQLYINEVVLGTLFGIIVGPYVADIFNPRSWSKYEHETTLEVMRVVLATGLFAIGVELPKAYLQEHSRGLLVMVVPTMAFGWLVVGG
jgi:NhaP-type Na+/H+ or K+/H+ antiporter